MIFIRTNLQGKELANWKFQRYMRDYMKTVKSLDDNVGRVLDYLKEKGLLDNTLVVYTSDQGFYMGEHGWFDKRFMYEESMRTPLIMRLPKGFDRRGDITEMVQNIDYAPTFLELAGAEIPSDIQGISLVPLLKGEHPKDWRKALYYHFFFQFFHYRFVFRLPVEVVHFRRVCLQVVEFPPVDIIIEMNQFIAVCTDSIVWLHIMPLRILKILVISRLAPVLFHRFITFQ